MGWRARLLILPALLGLAGCGNCQFFDKATCTGLGIGAVLAAPAGIADEALRRDR
ncbi:MAG: hypothetical protein Q4G14_03480 [Paracoccus sp. (in: a-proteobacteria)]|uniref:hypothetical protein n=1 Tax=Paracoccus sp. TaxID=267 RepID=UPI0026DEB135|nr:hypothetical protein [Paracoccus sp. (in: a-proteobacteria)]MDO5612288.1 hypothetical protein [Paracoccus sp. (in: a-proteobacteria)]